MTSRHTGLRALARAPELERHPPADGALVGPKLARHRFIDDRDLGSLGAIACVEAPTLQERDTQCLKVVRAHRLVEIQLNSRRLERRRQAEHHAGEKRYENAVPENRGTDTDTLDERELSGQRNQKRLKRSVRQANPESATEKTEQSTFCQELLQDPATPSAQSGSKGHLAPASFALREEQAGDVRTSDEQYQRDRKKDDKQ